METQLSTEFTELKRIADALERIAQALEIANIPKIGGGTSYVWSGWQCSICLRWINAGETHSCSGGSASA